MDLALLTVVIHYLGSLDSYAQFMYLFHIVLACIFLPYAQSLRVTLSAMGMYLICLALEAAGVVSPRSVLAVSLDARSKRHAVCRPGVVFRFRSLYFRDGMVPHVPPGKRLATAGRGIGRHQSASGGRHGRKSPVHAPHDPPVEGAVSRPSMPTPNFCLGGYCGKLPPHAVAVIGQIATRCEMLSRGIKAMLQLANLRSTAQTTPPPGPGRLAGA